MLANLPFISIALQDRIDQNEDCTSLKTDCNELFLKLTDSSPSLSPYDRKKYQTRVDSLLKLINTKESLTAKKSKLFQFQRKPRSTKKTPITDKTALNPQQETQITRDEHFVITKPAAVYQDLYRCQLTAKTEENTGVTGSLTLQNVNETIVKCQPLTFDSGSLFINNCEGSTIICDVPPHNAVQIRLHNLLNCRLLIRPTDATSRQVVVLENCSDCTFHKEAEQRLEIQNFTNLDLTDSGHEDYKYETFQVSYTAVDSPR